MSDIAILMSGVLMTRQPSSSNLIKLPVIRQEQNSQSSQRISAAKFASYRAIRPMNNFPATLALKFKPQKSRITTIKQVFAKDLDKLTKLSSSNFLRDKFSEQKRLVAKQRRDKLIFRKSQKVSFLNTQKLINKQNSNDNIVATSQSLNNQTLPSLRFKSSGIAVRALQRLLVANGYSVPVDGVFGAVTESAVKAFQAQKNLKVDGIVGLQTWDSLTMYNRFATVWS